MAENKRNRSKNFESSEIQLLMDLVEKHINIINSKLTNSITNDKKEKQLGKHSETNQCSCNRQSYSERNKNEMDEFTSSSQERVY